MLLRNCYKIRNNLKNTSYSILKQNYLNIRSSSSFNEKHTDDNLDELYEKYENKVEYNTILSNLKLNKGYKNNQIIKSKLENEYNKIKEAIASIQPLPITLRYYTDVKIEKKCDDNSKENFPENDEITQFPLESSSRIDGDVPLKDVKTVNRAASIDKEIRSRNEMLKDMENWMTGYDTFEESEQSLSQGKVEQVDEYTINYGTPDPSVAISKVPCGGCGALLHCKNISLPGYIPSEIFKNHNKRGGANLEALLCQRCYFLKNYNLALQVRVSADDYPKVLQTVARNPAVWVVLIVDLLDFPCSIWPGIADILGARTPIILVGNKVDLLPKDDKKYLTRIKRVLEEAVKLSGFGTANIRHTELISAKTGFGVENLITEMNRIWRYKGDVYLVGCTNVGKSSLFNALLRSDFCKVTEDDVIQRATTSQWPGTTLNLLKFPILRPSSARQFARLQRLTEIQKIEREERYLRESQLSRFNTPENATLTGRIERTGFSDRKIDPERDAFSVSASSSGGAGKLIMGINERDPKYALGRWCFDTPGVVQPDQITHLLTADELLKTLPNEIIRPQSFAIKTGYSLFIAGLARLDHVKGPKTVRFTVFRSTDLPITVCRTENAQEVYEEFLRSDLFVVPVNKEERLKKWCGLEMAREISITGTNWTESSYDIVLSNAGWIAINCGVGHEHVFRAWTPEKRGCHVRSCLLPKAVQTRGARIRFSPAYKAHKFI